MLQRATHHSLNARDRVADSVPLTGHFNGRVLRDTVDPAAEGTDGFPGETPARGSARENVNLSPREGHGAQRQASQAVPLSRPLSAGRADPPI